MHRITSGWKHTTLRLVGMSLVGALPAMATTIAVPADQPTIAAALAVAAPGDTVHVAGGFYNEKLEVPRGLDDLTIEGDVGFGSAVIGTAGTSDDILRIRANRVTVQNLVLVGGNTAIRLDYSTGSIVRGVVVSGARAGIRVTRGSANLIGFCLIADSTGGAGIDVNRSPQTSVLYNSVANTYREGIRVQNSSTAIVFGNGVDSAAGGDGLRIYRVAAGTVSLNVVTHSANNGLRIQTSPNITVQGNRADANRNFGLRVEGSPPIAAASDLVGGANTATDNLSGDFLVLP